LRRIAICMVVALVAWPTEGSETEMTFDDGQRLHANCLAHSRVEVDSMEGQGRWHDCYSAVIATYDTVMVLKPLTGGRTPFCVPETAKAGTLVEIVARWLAAHPEQRMQPSAYLVITALHDAFPCPVRIAPY
jgi:hypothetical protein